MKKLILSLFGTSLLASSAFAVTFQVVNSDYENGAYYKVQDKSSGGYMHGTLAEGQYSGNVAFSGPTDVGSYKYYRIIAQDATTGDSLTGWGPNAKECSFALHKVNASSTILDKNTCALDYLKLDYKHSSQKLTVTIHE